jgi:hypothetical protein
MSDSAPTSRCPSVHHPTISEYYPLVLRLGDYLRCLIDPADWSAVFDPVVEASQDDSAQQQLTDLLSGVLVSFSNPYAALIRDAWPSGSRRIGPQIQNQEDVSRVFSRR